MQQQVFKDIEQLVTALSERSIGPQPSVVLIEGFANSGKSTLAGRLATAIDAVHVELDEFLNKYQRTYVAHIRYSELSERLHNAVSESRRIVLEGVCAQEILSRTELTIATSVYVKRLVADYWLDGRILGEAGSLANAMSLEEAKTQITSELDKEVFAYHFQFRPHERSTFVYTWGV